MIRQIIMQLWNRCTVSESCRRRLTDAETAGRTVDDRLGLGDQEAIYDCLVEAIESLDAIREDVGVSLWSDSEHAKALQELRLAKQDAAATDRGGREPQRSGVRRTGMPVGHG